MRLPAVKPVSHMRTRAVHDQWSFRSDIAPIGEIAAGQMPAHVTMWHARPPGPQLHACHSGQILRRTPLRSPLRCRTALTGWHQRPSCWCPSLAAAAPRCAWAALGRCRPSWKGGKLDLSNAFRLQHEASRGFTIRAVLGRASSFWSVTRTYANSLTTRVVGDTHFLAACPDMPLHIDTKAAST